MAEIGAAFRRPFAEQEAALRLRLENQLPTQAWDDLRHNQHDRAWVVSGAVKADLLADIGEAILKAAVKGTTLDEFRRDFKKIVAERGWTGWAGEGSAKGEAWRTRVIYQTNLRTSYAAGRRAQLIAGKFAYWVYSHSGAEHPRLHHLAWDGVALPVDHPFWATHSPPNGWGCGCKVFGARSRAGIKRVGGDPDKQLPAGWDKVDEKTGLPPGLQKGWDYAPGASVSDLVTEMARKAEKLPSPLGDALNKHLGKLPAPLPPDDRPVVSWRKLQFTDDLGQINAAVINGGLAVRAGGSGLAPSGYSILAQVGVEVAQRFKLPPLAYFGGTRDFPPDLEFLVAPEVAHYDPVVAAVVLQDWVSDVNYTADYYAFGAGTDADRDAWTSKLRLADPEVVRRARNLEYPGITVLRDTADIVAHEMAHHLHHHYRGEIDRLIARHRIEEEGWGLLLSDYATTNKYELVAESFNLYMLRGQEQRFRLHPALLGFFLRRDIGR